MKLLNKILDHKRLEVDAKRKATPIHQLTQQPLFEREVRSLRKAIQTGSGVIAEFKRKSPSAGKIQGRTIADVLDHYQKNGVSAYSILTDETFFGGNVEDLAEAQQKVDGPVLRKEFIIDEYQLFEAKAFGADAVLLIAEVLDEYYATHLAMIAHSLGLEVLMEFHSEKSLDRLNEYVDIIGVNNRNLDTLQVDLTTSERMVKYLPYGQLKITESGIHSVDQLAHLYTMGYDGCLVGESVLKNPTILKDLCAIANETKAVKL